MTKNRAPAASDGHRFVPGGPELPWELLAAQARGEVLFVCGAGVSKNAGLPLFDELVKKIYGQLKEPEVWGNSPPDNDKLHREHALWQRCEYDRVLRELERRLIGPDRAKSQHWRDKIRDAVRQSLQPTSSSTPDLSKHLCLLQLSGEEGRTRLLTTNFDTLFERAWDEAKHDKLRSHAGPALPAPGGAGFEGILHLHGRLEDAVQEQKVAETDLVLTSAEFGEAYLRSGWASRYLYDLVRKYTLVLVGYQAEDPPLRYLLEAIEADRENYADLKDVYAFAERKECKLTNALWKAKGIKPLFYESHEALYETLKHWLEYAKDPTGWHKKKPEKLFGSPPPGSLTAAERGEVELLLRHETACSLLAELRPAATWLSRFEKEGFLVSTQKEEKTATPKVSPGEWLAACADDTELIRECAGLVAQRKLGSLEDWQPLDDRLKQGEPPLTPVLQRAWRHLREAALRPDPPKWEDLKKRLKVGAIDHFLQRDLVELLRPQAQVSRPEFDNSQPAGTITELRWLVKIEFKPSVPPAPAPPAIDELLRELPADSGMRLAFAAALDRALEDALEQAREVGVLQSDDGLAVPSVADHEQNADPSPSGERGGFFLLTQCIKALRVGLANDAAAKAERDAALRQPQDDHHDFAPQSKFWVGNRLPGSPTEQELDSVPDELRVAAALADPWREPVPMDSWSRYCKSDAQGGLRALEAHENAKSTKPVPLWMPRLWAGLLCAADKTPDPQFHRKLATHLLRMPDSTWVDREVIGGVAFWLGQSCKPLFDDGAEKQSTGNAEAQSTGDDAKRLWFSVWDRLQEELAKPAAAGTTDDLDLPDNVYLMAINNRGGRLAESLLDALEVVRKSTPATPTSTEASTPASTTGAELPEGFQERLGRLLEAPGKDGRLGRAVMTNQLAQLYQFWRPWCEAELLPKLQVRPHETGAAEARWLWESCLWRRNLLTSDELFRALKLALLSWLALSQKRGPVELSYHHRHRRARGFERGGKPPWALVAESGVFSRLIVE